MVAGSPGRRTGVGAAVAAGPRRNGRRGASPTRASRASCSRARRRRAAAAEEPSLRLSIAGRAVLTLIAETGGQNAMSSTGRRSPAGRRRVVASAFDSAGQRCSALRVLCLQADGADRIVAMLKGAMAESRIGSTREPGRRRRPGDRRRGARGDRGPRHPDARARPQRLPGRPQRAGCDRAGHFVVPTLIELDRLDELEREVFGPVLHVVRYRRRDLRKMIEQVNATGYGLTLGVQSRIDETIAEVVAGARVGNVYVNRNMVGAVVGVQPFGGEGLSGTGPKAGGPLYLYRLLARSPADAMARAVAADSVDESPPLDVASPLRELERWAERRRQGGARFSVPPVRRRVARRRRVAPRRADRRAQRLHAAAARRRAVPRGGRQRSPGAARRRPRRPQPRPLAERLGVAARPPARGGARTSISSTTGPRRRRGSTPCFITAAPRSCFASARRSRRGPGRSSASRDCVRARARCRSSASSSSAH